MDPANPLSKRPAASNISYQEWALDVIAQKRDSVYADAVREREAWHEIIAAAERHNDPGKFSTFIGFEWTSHPGGSNLHRNVIFKGNRVPQSPFSAIDSQDPEDLWDWLDGLRDADIESLAIPHNMNFSNGQGFGREDFSGDPIGPEYAEQRNKNEPVVEIIQEKGASETHPLLSSNDEWAAFQVLNTGIGKDGLVGDNRELSQLLVARALRILIGIPAIPNAASPSEFKSSNARKILHPLLTHLHLS